MYERHDRETMTTVRDFITYRTRWGIDSDFHEIPHSEVNRAKERGS